MKRFIFSIHLKWTRRWKHVCVKAVFFLTVLAFLVIVFSHFSSQVYIPTRSFLETDKCPACYGMKQCADFMSHITIPGWSRLWVHYSFLNTKNVFFGNYTGLADGKSRKTVLKKLAHNDELKAFETKVCNRRFKDSSTTCDVGSAIRQLIEDDSLMNLVKGVADMTECPTERLMNLMAKSMYDMDTHSLLSLDEQMYLLSTLMVNQEPVILQAFPRSQGWPFPQFYGACGRVIAEEHGGKLLSDYHDAPWSTRVLLAFKIMRIADDLTNKDQHFALYWTDLKYKNMAVDKELSVLIIDAENIVVVDKTEIKNTKPENWDVPAESIFDDCPGNCLSYRTDVMCSQIHVDHNYYAACRNLISPQAQVKGYPGGLLHDIPKHVRDLAPNLEYLLNECSKPSKPGGRMKIVDELIKTLDRLLTVGDPILPMAKVNFV